MPVPPLASCVTPGKSQKLSRVIIYHLAKDSLGKRESENEIRVESLIKRDRIEAVIDFSLNASYLSLIVQLKVTSSGKPSLTFSTRLHPHCIPPPLCALHLSAYWVV